MQERVTKSALGRECPGWHLSWILKTNRHLIDREGKEPRLGQREHAKELQLHYSDPCSQLGLTLPPWEYWRCLGTFLVVTTKRGLVGQGSCQTTYKAQNSPHPQQRMIWPWKSRVPQLRKLALDVGELLEACEHNSHDPGLNHSASSWRF